MQNIKNSKEMSQEK